MRVCLCASGLPVFLRGKICKEFKKLGKVKRGFMGFLVERKEKVLDWLASVFGGKVLILLEFWVFGWAS